MRKLTILTTIGALVAGFCLATPALASVTAPANGAVIAGTTTFTESPGGAKTGTLCITGGNASTSLSIKNNSTGVSTSLGSNGGGALSVAFDTHALTNGAYTVTGTEVNVTGTVFCSGKTSTFTSGVTVDNVVAISYTSATIAPQNTTVAVSATLTDPNLSTSVLPGRVLTFSLGGGASVQATTGSNGVATANLPISGPPRSTTLAVSFAGTTFYDAKTQNVAFVVAQDPTATTISPLTASVHGQPVAFTASVAATAGGGTPTGTVQFAVDGTNYGAPVTLVGGTATTPSTSTLSTATHTITAQYSGDPNYLASSATPASQVVNKASTATALSANPPSAVHGQPITFTANVSVTGLGAGTPTGAVQFDVDGAPFGTAVALTGTSASLTIANLSTADHTVSATYDGDPNFALSNSNNVDEHVGQAGTTSTLTSSDQTSVFGESITYSVNVAAVAPGAGTPTGTATFEVDGQPIGNPVQLVDGSATSDAISLLTPGAHMVTVSYSGDGDFNGSTDQLTQTVNQDPTKTVITSSNNPSVFGQPVTFHATVSAAAPGSGTPTGTVQFFINGVASGDPVELLNGAADSTAVSNLEPGTYTVNAVYSGDDDYVTSTSADLSQQVNRAATTTLVSSSVNPSVFGQPVTFTASVSVNAPGAGNPTGTITFTDGGTVLGVVGVDSSTGEIATLTTGALVVAPHAIVATYSGDSDFLTSSDSLTQTVMRAQSSTLVSSSANPSTSGQPVTFTATISPVAPGAGVPGGTVVFTVNGAPLGSAATVVNGVGTSTAFASLTPGKYSIGASYSGDGNFVGSSATLDEGNGQNVTANGTTTAVTTSGTPVNYAAPVTFTATVTPTGLGNGKPSGVVDFFDGSQLLGAAQLAPVGTNSSKASFTYSTLSTGAHTITAQYVGNYNFTGSSATVAQSVNAMPTTLGLISSINPTFYEQPTVFTAFVSGPTGTPGGTVTFRDGTTVLGTATLAVNAQGADAASLLVSTLQPGSHAITATYNGATAYSGSTGSLTQTVTKATSELVANVIITDQAALDRDGARLHLSIGEVSATLTANGHPLAGQTIVFTTHGLENPTIPVCTATTDANGYAFCNTSVNDVDNNLVTIISANGYLATYSGNADFTGATSHGALDQ